jgi:pyruvate dehydrogenase E1 component alpha subunit
MRTERDPIDNLKTMLIAGGHADEDGLKQVDRDVRALVSEAAEFAQNSPEPDPAELYTDVLVDA